MILHHFHGFIDFVLNLNWHESHHQSKVQFDMIWIFQYIIHIHTSANGDLKLSKTKENNLSS